MQGFPCHTTADRSARHVRRLRVRTSDAAARLTVQTMLEEALRLTTLPGEDQGRVYCFRRLQLSTVDLRAGSEEWIDSCSSHLRSMGASAIPASAPAAAHADAVFFSDVQEPWRRLVARLLLAEAAPEWFWSQATGIDTSLPGEIRLERALDRWRVQPGGWSAVAREILPTLDPPAARRLVAMLRPAAAQHWLEGMSAGSRTPPVTAIVPAVRSRTRDLLRHARARFPDRDVRVQFLAALAVLESAAGGVPDGSVRELAARVLDEPTPATESNDWRERFARSRQAAHPTANREGTAGSCGFDPESSAPDGATRAGKAAPASRSPGPLSSEPSDTAADRQHPARDPGANRGTAFAGLYFLLHPLRHLGIAEAIDTHPELAATHFVARVLLRLSIDVALDWDDPILLPIAEELSEERQRAVDPLVLPRTFSRLRHVRPCVQPVERLWAVALRYWCRRFANMSVNEIVRRPGRIHVTPTSIDVTMPMSAVDLRIRRCGLDIDPGYLPWLGRVVHFHYHTEASQPVVKVRRRNEADEGPGSPGAKRENAGSI
ncbi:MAG: hypothetical protein ABJA98_11020 [Acidobacteriota bacterium]